MPLISTSDGMTLGEPALPPAIWPTLSTAAWLGGTLRPMMPCTATMNCAATNVGSVPRSGMAPWPPVPLKVTCQLSEDASMAPERMAKRPVGMPGMLCMP